MRVSTWKRALQRAVQNHRRLHVLNNDCYDIVPSADNDGVEFSYLEAPYFQHHCSIVCAACLKNVLLGDAEDGYIWQEGDGAATASNAFTAESSSSASPAEQGYVWQQGGATGNSLAPSESTDSSTAAPFGGLFNDLGISTSSSQESSSGTSTTSTTAASDVSTSREVKKGLHKGDRQPGETPQFSKFPVLREGDGDRAVHTLHVRYLHQ